jgi:hypothetical protein
MSGNKERGRPLKTTDDLPQNWEEDILKEAKVGASIVELAVMLDISRTTFYSLCDRDENFLDTVKKCKRLSEAWWKKQGRTQLENKDFSYTGWYMNMKNRFGWADKQETKQTNEGEIKIVVDEKHKKDLDDAMGALDMD